MCCPDTPTPFFPPIFLLSQATVLSAESLTADRLSASLDFSTTSELLPVHLIPLVKMPTYGYKSVFAQTAPFTALNGSIARL